MKALSIWQPWASLIITGRKRIETRSWAAPSWIRGKRIAVASTKQVQRQQKMAITEPSFSRHYMDSGLPALDDLPKGVVLGTVLVVDCRAMDHALIGDLTEQELAYGWYSPGRYAWFLDQPEAFEKPIPVRGGQRLWNWSPG